LKKTLFDCSKIGDFYDCGCGDEKDEQDKNRGQKMEMDSARKEKLVAGGRHVNAEDLNPGKVEIEREG
jgi:FAD-linked sulfhydryl oxidase